MQTGVAKYMDFRYHILRLATIAARFLPVRLGYFLAECGGDALFLLSTRYRNIVHNNIKRVPELEVDKRRLRWQVRSVLKHMTKNYFDLTKLPQLTLDDLDGRTTIEGWHHLTRAVNSGRGTIIATAHLGNFELATHVLALRGIKMSVFIEAFDSTPFLRYVAKLRQRNGGRIVPFNIGALRDAVQTLRHGGTMVIACDRNTYGNGLKVNFFGKETPLPSVAVSLALRTGATIVPIFSVRKSNNHSVIHIEPPLKMVDIGNRGHSIRANLEKLVAIMERYIRQYPEQWVVLEPIWRNRVAEYNATQHID